MSDISHDTNFGEGIKIENWNLSNLCFCDWYTFLWILSKGGKKRLKETKSSQENFAVFLKRQWIAIFRLCSTTTGHFNVPYTLIQNMPRPLQNEPWSTSYSVHLTPVTRQFTGSQQSCRLTEEERDLWAGPGTYPQPFWPNTFACVCFF